MTLSLEACPACGKPHHLPLVFLERQAGQYEAQCTNTLKVIKGFINQDERLEVEK